MEFSRRSDLDISGDQIESCWIELARTAKKSIVIGCVYRNPKGSRALFYNILKDQLDKLNTKQHEMLVLGDINENLLKYNEGKQTSDYLEMLLSSGFMPIITKPTRITDHTATLIDHIYTNTPDSKSKDQDSVDNQDFSNSGDSDFDHHGNGMFLICLHGLAPVYIPILSSYIHKSDVYSCALSFCDPFMELKC